MPVKTEFVGTFMIIENMLTQQTCKLLSPYLDWESRLNLNIALPKSSRVYNRFSKEDCDRHEIHTWVPIFKEKLLCFEEAQVAQTRAELSYRLFKHFDNPRSLILPMRHVNFKMSLIERLLYFADKKQLKTLGISTDLANKLSLLSKNLIPTMLSLKHTPMKNKQTHAIQIV